MPTLAAPITDTLLLLASLTTLHLRRRCKEWPAVLDGGNEKCRATATTSTAVASSGPSTTPWFVMIT
jgi:hypothetical protein